MLKRAFDIIVSAAGLVILSPLLVMLALAVKLDSRGPALYRARRVGRGGREFRLLKFRSMVIDADKTGPAVTGANDSRVTKVGRLLRRTKLDELPQLWNVLVGEMSLVGPRPESPQYVAYYTDEQRQVLNVRPGITSAASVAYRHEEAMLEGDDWEERYIRAIMPAKLAIDLEYARNPSLRKDFGILWATAKALVS